jgi:hypothetical protein
VARLNVTDDLVRELVEGVAPLVSRLTGWDLDVPGVRQRVVSKNLGHEEIILARLRGVGLVVDDEGPRTTIDRLMEYVVAETMLGAYEPSTQEMLIVRDNVDESNLDGLRLIIAHELVHRGQHVNHPELFGRVGGWIREAYTTLEDGRGNSHAMATHVDELQPIMTVLESHAHYVEHTVNRLYLPAARIEAKLDVALLLMQVMGAAKVAQYVDGLPAVAAATAEGRIDELYREL